MKDINLEEILSKAKEVQDKFQEIQKNFTEKRVTDIAGIENEEKIFVKATVDGTRLIKTLDIGDGAWQQGPKIIIELIITAINNATEKLNKQMQSEVKKLYTPDPQDKADDK